MHSDRTVEARRWQYLIALVFLILGGWCLIAPANVVDLTVLPEKRNSLPLTSVAIGAFGAQAMLVGLVSTTSHFTARTFVAMDFAILSFFIFDWWVYFEQPLCTELILLDVLGSDSMLGACMRGSWLLRQQF